MNIVHLRHVFNLPYDSQKKKKKMIKDSFPHTCIYYYISIISFISIYKISYTKYDEVCDPIKGERRLFCSDFAREDLSFRREAPSRLV